MKKTILLLVAALIAGPANVQAQVTAEEFDKLKARVTELEKQLKRVADGAVKQGKVIKDVAGSVAALGKRVVDNEVKLEDLVRPDPSNPQKYVIDVLGNMQRSAAFRGDVHTATIGRLLLTNDTRSDQHLYINGTLWRVVQGKSYVTVPRGAVSVQRPNARQETLENWQYDHGRGFVLQYNFSSTAPAAMQ